MLASYSFIILFTNEDHGVGHSSSSVLHGFVITVYVLVCAYKCLILVAYVIIYIRLLKQVRLIEERESALMSTGSAQEVNGYAVFRNQVH